MVSGEAIGIERREMEQVETEVGGREGLTKAHKEMIVLTDQMHQKH